MKPIEVRTGSDSDIPKIEECYGVLDHLGLSFSARILSAHRTPDRMVKQANSLAADGFLVSIAAAGGSAHLPGMTAAETIRPVIGIPVRSSVFKGLDSLLSIIQMPEGVPTGCVGIGDAANAGLCAAKMVSLRHRQTAPALRTFMGLSRTEATVPATGSGVAVVDAAGPNHAGIVASMVNMFTSFGLDVQVHTADRSGKAFNAEILEKGGVANVTVVLVLCDVMNTGTVPAAIGATTHLPVVGLPLLQHADRHDPEVVLERLQEYLVHRPADSAANGMVSMGINRVKNAVLYALQIEAIVNRSFEKVLTDYRKKQYDEVEAKDHRLIDKGIDSYL